MTVDEMIERFKPFCAADSPRLGKPFMNGDWLCATDGHVCVRALLPEAIVRCKDHGPDLMPLEWTRDRYVAEAVHLPVVSEPKTTPCARCSGTGWTTCNYCGADNVCELCNSSGIVNDERNEPVQCGPVQLARYIVWTLQEAGVTEIFPRADGKRRPAYFQGDGFEGLAMPVGALE